jgi:membrane protease YdiL (CAAX protease family)
MLAVRDEGGSMSRNWWARLSAVFVLACLIWLLVNAVATAIFGADYSLPSHVFRAITTSALVLPALALVLRWEGTGPSDYGIAFGRGMARGLGVGTVAYFIPFLLAASTILALNLASLTVDATPFTVLGQGIVLLALVILYEAVPEELIFRGYLFQALAERLPGWATILTQAALFSAFGAIIGAATTLDRVALFFVFSLSLGFLRQVTGTVFATIGFHAVFQLLAQWLVGDHWTAVSLSDPEEWFALVALGLAPFLFAPVVARLLVPRSPR